MLSFTIPRTVHLASQVLPAAGAFTSQDFAVLPPGTREMVYWITYTRAPGFTGYPQFLVQWSNGVEEAFELVLDKGTIVVAQPAGDFNTYVEEILAPIPGSDAALSYVYEFVVPYGASGGRLLAAEKGDVNNPGSIVIAYTGGTGAP